VSTDPNGTDKAADADLINWMLSLQEEDAPDAGSIPPLRLAQLALDPASATPDEQLTLTLSPTTRRDLALTRQALLAPAVNDNVFSVVSLAAADGAERPITLDLDDLAQLVVEPGPAADLPYILSLTVRPHLPGGVAHRRVVVRERGSGLIWLDDTTDGTGSVHAVWPHPGLVPARRLDADDLQLALPGGVP
jgi:hypothetical protein